MELLEKVRQEIETELQRLNRLKIFFNDAVEDSDDSEEVIRMLCSKYAEYLFAYELLIEQLLDGASLTIARNIYEIAINIILISATDQAYKQFVDYNKLVYPHKFRESYSRRDLMKALPRRIKNELKTNLELIDNSTIDQNFEKYKKEYYPSNPNITLNDYWHGLDLLSAAIKADRIIHSSFITFKSLYYLLYSLACNEVHTHPNAVLNKYNSKDNTYGYPDITLIMATSYMMIIISMILLDYLLNRKLLNLNNRKEFEVLKNEIMAG